MACQVRKLNLQEYQSKKLMADADISVQQFLVASSPEDASTIASKLCKTVFNFKSRKMNFSLVYVIFMFVKVQINDDPHD